MGWLRITGIAGALMLLALVVMVNRPAPDVSSAPGPAQAGWEALGPCTDTASLDGRWTLELQSDGRATTSGSTEKEAANGNWSFDPARKLYLVTFPGLSAAYRLVVAEGVSCMLIAGDLNAANLRASWFASAPSRSMDDDPVEAPREPDR